MATDWISSGRRTGSIPQPPAFPGTGGYIPASKPGSVRSGIDRLIAQNPTWVVYIRRDPNIPCRYCYSEEDRYGTGLCPHCYGTGYKVTLEKLPVYYYMRRIEHKPDIQEAEGFIADTGVTMDFRRDDYPDEQDLVLEVEWNVPMESIQSIGQPVRVHHVYVVNMIRPMYEGGEVAFYTTSVRIADINKLFYDSLLVKGGV